MELGSGVKDETVRSVGCCRVGGWKLFALVALVVFGNLGTPVAVFGVAVTGSRRFALLNEGERPIRDCVVSLGILPVSDRPSKLLEVGSMPGPTLFLGARAAGFGGACGGNWLCRRVRIDMLEVELAVAAVGNMVEVSVPLEAVEAPLGFLVPVWLKRRMKELLRAGRLSAGAVVKVCMLGMLVLEGTLLLKEPGAGKSLRLGS